MSHFEDPFISINLIQQLFHETKLTEHSMLTENFIIDEKLLQTTEYTFCLTNNF